MAARSCGILLCIGIIASSTVASQSSGETRRATGSSDLRDNSCVTGGVEGVLSGDGHCCCSPNCPTCGDTCNASDATPAGISPDDDDSDSNINGADALVCCCEAGDARPCALFDAPCIAVSRSAAASEIQAEEAKECGAGTDCGTGEECAAGVCVGCSSGHYKASAGPEKCAKCETTCDAGESLTGECSASKSPECRPCGQGQFKEREGDAECEDCRTSCPDGATVISICTASVDLKCEEPNDCRPKEGKCAANICEECCEDFYFNAESCQACVADRCDPPDPCALVDCGTQGRCILESNGAAKCYCSDNYTGEKCDRAPGPSTPPPPNCDPACSEHGECSAEATCLCGDGYEGDDCSAEIVPNRCSLTDDCNVCDECCHANLPEQFCSMCVASKCIDDEETEDEDDITAGDTDGDGNDGGSDIKTKTCDEVHCGSNGACNSETTECECYEGYSGLECADKDGDGRDSQFPDEAAENKCVKKPFYYKKNGECVAECGPHYLPLQSPDTRERYCGRCHPSCYQCTGQEATECLLCMSSSDAAGVRKPYADGRCPNATAKGGTDNGGSNGVLSPSQSETADTVLFWVLAAGLLLVVGLVVYYYLNAQTGSSKRPRNYRPVARPRRGHRGDPNRGRQQQRGNGGGIELGSWGSGNHLGPPSPVAALKGPDVASNQPLDELNQSMDDMLGLGSSV